MLTSVPASRRQFLGGVLGFGLGLAGTAISRVSAAPATEATPTLPAGVEVTSDLAYVSNPGPRQILDLYIPTSATQALPLLIWIHGGGWERGSKESVLKPGKAAPIYLLEDGWAFASLDYRLSSDAIFPAQIQDVNAAISYLWNQADTYNLDRERVVVAGNSAGGHLSLLAGLSANNPPEEFQANPEVRIAGILDYYGPADLSYTAGSNRDPNERVIALLGGTPEDKPELAHEASPVTYIDSQDPPTLILQGGDDPLVRPAQSKALDRQLTTAGVQHQLMILPGVSHGGPGFQSPKVKTTVREFVTSLSAQ